MSDKSATPILVAGAVGTVILLGVAWMFAASASRQAVVDAEAYAAEKAELPTSQVVPRDDVTEKITEAAVAEVQPEEAATTEVVASDEKEVAEAEGASEVEEAAESVAVAEAETPPEPEAGADGLAVAGATTATLEVGGDAAAGAKVFRKCRACHKVGDGATNAVGPYLTGVVGRVQGSAEGYANYSEGFTAAMSEGKVWTPEELDAFLTKPKDYMPGNNMSFPGLRKAKDRANVIAYLSSVE